MCVCYIVLYLERGMSSFYRLSHYNPLLYPHFRYLATQRFGPKEPVKHSCISLYMRCFFISSSLREDQSIAQFKSKQRLTRIIQLQSPKLNHTQDISTPIL